MARQKKSFAHQVGTYTGLAVLLPLSTASGYIIGTLLDRAFGTHFLYLIFLLLGIASGFIQLIRQFLRDSRDGES